MIIFIILILLIVVKRINIGYKEPQQISKTIKESIDKRVFVSQYSIKNIHILKNNYKFPIENVWLEKIWHETVDKWGNTGYELYEGDDMALVFKFNNYDTLLNASNICSGKWCFILDSFNILQGSVSGMLNFSIPTRKKRNNYSVTIVKTTIPNSLQNVYPIVKFDLINSGQK